MFRNRQAAIVSFAALVLTLVIYWPGILTQDSKDQLVEITTGPIRDWHPPIMAVLWLAFNQIHEGSEIIFVYQVTLYWLAWYFLARAVATRRPTFGLFVPLLGLLPMTFNFVGMIWKDVHLANACLCAMSLILVSRVEGWQHKQAALFVAALLLCYGVLVRVNAITMIGFLMPFVVNTKRQSVILALLIGMPVVLLGASNVVNRDMIGAERSKVINSLYVFDLGGISHFAHKNYLPELSEDEAKQIVETCYTPEYWNVYGFGTCNWATRAWWKDKFGPAWIDAILSQPKAYLAHRISHFLYYLRVGHEKGYYTFHWVVGGGGLAKNYVLAFERTPLLKPWFWLMFSAIISVAAFFRLSKARIFADFAFWLACSATSYNAAYFFIGVASDFRYSYWSVLAGLAAAAALVTDLGTDATST